MSKDPGSGFLCESEEEIYSSMFLVEELLTFARGHILGRKISYQAMKTQTATPEDGCRALVSYEVYAARFLCRQP